MKIKPGFSLLVAIALIGIVSCVEDDFDELIHLPVSVSWKEKEPDPDPDSESLIAIVDLHINCTGVFMFYGPDKYLSDNFIEGGTYLSAAPNPVDNDIKCWTDPHGKGYRSETDLLQPGTTYYARAYIVGSKGTYYTDEVSFTTNPPPEITTTNITDISRFTAMVGGDITSTGGSFVVERGVCYDTVPGPEAYISPTIEQEVQSTDGAGEFAVKLTNLIPGTKYYVKTFVGVMTGTAYGDQLFEFGEELSFTTKP
jgi:hypothetical protein